MFSYVFYVFGKVIFHFTFYEQEVEKSKLVTAPQSIKEKGRHSEIEPHGWNNMILVFCPTKGIIFPMQGRGKYGTH